MKPAAAEAAIEIHVPDLGAKNKQKIKTEDEGQTVVEREESGEAVLGPIKGFMASRFELENEIER